MSSSLVKKLLVFILVACATNMQAQTMRFFEFTVQVDSPWQDTSFIAATADPAVIDTVLADLAKPIELRRFMNGRIDYGNGGCNHNAGHWFLWHFIPGQWMLTDASIELCDGRPYSDVDADTAYWINTVGRYCPWHSKPAREVPDPLTVNNRYAESGITIGPNPASGQLMVFNNASVALSLVIYDITGRSLISTTTSEQKHAIDISLLKAGIYFLHITYGEQIAVKQFVVE